jgi:hypothetical protein
MMGPRNPGLGLRPWFIQKLACKFVFGWVMVTTSGLFVDPTSPVQLTKCQPLLAVTVIVTLLPAG